MSQSIANVSEFEIGYAIGFLSAKGEQFSTIDIIRKILGTYQSDKDMPGGSSPNALFGKKLSLNAEIYRIQRVPPDKPGKDDSGNPTTTAIWRPVLTKRAGVL